MVNAWLPLSYADEVEEMLTDVTQDRDRRSGRNFGGRKRDCCIDSRISVGRLLERC